MGTDLVRTTAVFNPVPPAEGHVYWLWVGGCLTEDQLWAFMDRWPSLVLSAQVETENNYTLILFKGGVPNDLEINPMVGSFVFVMSMSSDFKFMRSNRDMTPERARQLRDLLSRLDELKRMNALASLQGPKNVKRLT